MFLIEKACRRISLIFLRMQRFLPIKVKIKTKRLKQSVVSGFR